MRIDDVIASTGLSRSTIYRMIANEEFPPQILLTKRCIGWWQSGVDSWLRARMATISIHERANIKGARKGAPDESASKKKQPLQVFRMTYTVAACPPKLLRSYGPSFGPSPVARPGANLATFRSVQGCRADIVRENASRDGIRRASNRDA